MHAADSVFVLAMDTSTRMAGVAVIDTRSRTPVAAGAAAAERHSSNLLRLCVETTKAAGVSMAQLRGIACGAGPGSFTGLRVGVAVAKGLALPHGLPLVLVSSLQALAWDLSRVAKDDEALLPCLDAGKGQVFVSVCARGGDATPDIIVSRSQEWAVTPELLPELLPENGSFVCGGTGAERYGEVLSAGLGSRLRISSAEGPTAEAIAALAIPRLLRDDTDDLDTAVPSYGRAPDITRPKNRTA